MILVKGLHKHFGKLCALNGIDEHIKKGETVVIMGPSGSGKSTFLRCVALLEAPTAGEIHVGGELITAPKYNAGRLRAKMGVVFRRPNLFCI